MTRETKIGLLVGLAFIIVIGVLLSDHLTTRGELPQAQLTQVGDNVRVSSSVPTSSVPPIAPVAVPTVTPTSQVATQDELHQKPATALVQVTPPKPGTTGADIVVNVGQQTTHDGEQQATVIQAPSKDEPRVGLSLLGSEPKPGTPADNMTPVGPNQPVTLALHPDYKQIKAEKGDTVSRLAAKYLGGNTAANRQAIIDANPALKANPTKIVIGHTYMIPTKSADKTPAIADTVPLTGAPDPATATPLTTTTTTKADTRKPAVATSSYKVKANDTLWKIASTQLGDGSLTKEIKDLNKDVLKGKDVLREGMTLKLPAKQSVASR